MQNVVAHNRLTVDSPRSIKFGKIFKDDSHIFLHFTGVKNVCIPLLLNFFNPKTSLLELYT
jgi:hypothetical protein